MLKIVVWALAEPPDSEVFRVRGRRIRALMLFGEIGVTVGLGAVLDPMCAQVAASMAKYVYTYLCMTRLLT